MKEADKLPAFAKAFSSEIKVVPTNVGNDQLEAANKMCARLAKSFNLE